MFYFFLLKIKVYVALDMSSLVTCTVQVENNNKMAGHNDRLANGINVGTNYRLLSIDKVNYTEQENCGIGRRLSDSSYDFIQSNEHLTHQLCCVHKLFHFKTDF